MTKSICTVLARGGSKGVPGKNIRPLCGKPLIAWSIEQARGAGIFDLIAVSSDDPDILAAAQAAGAGLLVERPADMATDSASKLPSNLHCLLAAEGELGGNADIIVDLQPTSPVRLIQDILDAVALQKATGASSVITGQTSKCSPYFSLVEAAPDGTVRLAKALDGALARRHDAPVTYDMNGSIYVWERETFVADLGNLLSEHPDFLRHATGAVRGH